MGMEYRPYYLAREWQKMGHEVTIVGGTYSHLRAHNPPASGWQEYEGVSYLWLKTPRYQGNGGKRAISMFVFVLKLFLRAGAIRRRVRPDLVIASSTYTLDIYPAWWMARRARAKLVYEVHDLWPLSPIELGGISPKHPFMRLLQHGENFACRKADKVVSILPCTQDHLVEHGMAPEKFVYVPNGVVEEEWENPVPLNRSHAEVLDKLRAEGWFLVGYAGAHGVANNLEILVQSARLFTDELVKIILVGSGEEKNRLMNLVHEIRSNNVVFLDPVPKNQVPQLLSFFDVLHVGSRDLPLYRFGIGANKILDYMMAGKPVILESSAPQDLVRQTDCGISIRPGKAEEIGRAIRALRSLSVEERTVMGDNGRRYARQKLTYAKLAEQFLEGVDSV